ncbi:MAG TPA: histidine kinase [Pararhizobium sp.]|uniref:histidine kinase n=1 Tax=Pararhizobium sp. TaxID=1977563 RepID=UPI002C7ADB1F|nr:histidine kinase [Pararhizobium sp.]HTO34427.1 histidine kinase [Pararhizobium sp.]
MIEEIVGNNGTKFIIAAGAVALGLLCLVGVLWFIRNRPSSPFIRGGKNRQPRLAVLDAAAIDTRRRLVLVRRDDVEHLIMIGGPTDVVIESRIATPSPVATAAVVTQEAGVARPQPERALPERPIERPAAEQRRVAPQPETRPAPVSGMGQVLYGDNTDTAPQPVRAVQPTLSRSQPETVVRQPRPEHTVAIPDPQPRPQPVASSAIPQPAPGGAARTPEDILESARNRVLAANQTVPVQRPQTEPGPLVAATQAAVPAIQTQPVLQTQPAVQAQRERSAAEFERILDAEITGDLGKLTVDDIRLEAEQRNSPANATVRQEPRLGTTPGGRNEPSLEDEMNRMLSEIAVTRKN